MSISVAAVYRGEVALPLGLVDAAAVEESLRGSAAEARRAETVAAGAAAAAAAADLLRTLEKPATGSGGSTKRQMKRQLIKGCRSISRAVHTAQKATKKRLLNCC